MPEQTEKEKKIKAAVLMLTAAASVLLLLTCASVYFLGISLLLMGVVLCICACLKGVRRISLFVLAGILIVWGVVITAVLILGDSHEWNKTILYTLLLGGAAAMFLLQFFGTICAIFVCKETISAVFEEVAVSHGYKGFSSYTLHFSYQYNGTAYTGPACEIFFRSKAVSKKYQKGQRYPVFINPKQPSMICVRRRIGFFDILCLLMGLLFLYVLLTEYIL